jgi:hypothetical protein
MYSLKTLDLGGAPGGDIDAHVWEDDDGKVYLLWKTDDNNVGATTTRLWGCEIKVTAGTVAVLSHLFGGSRMLLVDLSDSTPTKSWT